LQAHLDLGSKTMFWINAHTRSTWLKTAKNLRNYSMHLCPKGT
jgi:hypothetical protein